MIPSDPRRACLFGDKNEVSPLCSLTIIQLFGNFFFDLFAYSKKALTFAAYFKLKEERSYELEYIH